MEHSNLTDEALMELYQQDSTEAFVELYKRHSGLAYGYLIKKTNNNTAAQDILQNVFLKLHIFRMKYNKNLPFLPWFFVVMKNTLSDYFKASKNIPVSNIENNAAFEVQSSDFQDLVLNLPPRYQEALELRYVQDLDFDKIAESMKTSEVNVRKIISRAIKQLKNTLNRRLK